MGRLIILDTSFLKSDIELTLDLRTDVNKDLSAAEVESGLGDECNSWILIAIPFYINLVNFHVYRSPSVREKESEGILDTIRKYSKVVCAREIVARLAATIYGAF